MLAVSKFGYVQAVDMCLITEVVINDEYMIISATRPHLNRPGFSFHAFEWLCGSVVVIYLT